MIYPNHFEPKIGFSQIRSLLKARCLSSLGTDCVDAMTFMTDYPTLMHQLQQVVEFVRIIQEADDFPDQYFYDVRPALQRVEIEGLYLDEHELFDLRRSLQTIHDVSRFLQRGVEDETPVRRGHGSYAEPLPVLSEEEEVAIALAERKALKGLYPHLRLLTVDIQTFPKVINRVDQILDKYGKIRDNASPQLREIRRELATTTSGVSKSLHSILRSAQQQGYVEKDASPTMRDGRLVIPVAPAMKRRVPGIVHDESATGKTVFIEPTQVVEANNRIRELEGEEKREIIRILQQFTDALRPNIPAVMDSYLFLGQIDYIRAKAQYAIHCQGLLPTVVDEQMVDWREAVHPLLADTLRKQDKKVVPLDITLTQDKRMLIISGPNAGGKSVCLKTVGLLQYMLQCGLLVPVHEQSTMGLFHHLFIDIGDEQSIEDDLSTYSSHLMNMKMMLRHCDGQSLILIDEFGGGTEPQIGGAIAQSVLARFLQQESFGVITTHYQNLKHFADENMGAVNGAMLYDRHEMRALYELQIGNPGSSFAVEIARKIGLPEEVIQEASELVGSEYISSDKYLQDIVRDKRYWDRKRQSIRVEEKKLRQTVERYEKEMSELQKERKSILQEAKTKAEDVVRSANAQVEKTIRDIKQAEAEKQRTKEIRQELAEFKEALSEADKAVEDKIARKMESLRRKQERKKKKKGETEEASATEGASASAEASSTKAAHSSKSKKKEEIAVGSFVYLEGQRTVGEVLEVKGKQAVVAFGNLKTTVKLNRLSKTIKHPKKQQTDTVATFVSKQTKDNMRDKQLHFRQELDVRGMRGDEAVQSVTYYIDDAIMVGVQRVRILHGTGTGILRTLIRQYLATNPGVKHFADEHVQFGGAGVTVVELGTSISDLED
ncbi:MAG TPA: Smr/MutS family protein [Bacteroidaceae bacterium]|nr:Smr/MutS family protein [Bacteroidaceae bacterium]